MLTCSLGIKAAARHLGLEKKYIDEVMLWNGNDVFPEVEFKEETEKPKKKVKGEQAKPKDGATNPGGGAAGPTEISAAVQEIYNKSTSSFLKLWRDSADRSEERRVGKECA